MTVSGFEAFIGEFLLDTGERVEQVEEHLLGLGSATSSDRTEVMIGMKRELHTIKGNAGMMGLAEIQKLAHAMEERLGETCPQDVEVVGLLKILDEIRHELGVAGGEASEDKADTVSATGQVAGSVRVPFTSLDAIMDLLAEMVITRNRVTREITVGRALDPSTPEFAERSADAWRELGLTYQRLARSMDFVQEMVTRLRMVPLSSLFGSLQRIVHDEAAGEGKSVQLLTEGGDTPLDKSLLDLASEALGHLVRNAVIHGIESPGERAAVGKNPQSTVRVVASARGDEVVIGVSDDGGGIDPESLRKAAQERGIDTTTLEDIYSVLFMAGFSTKSTVDLSSGRGVGLAAVLDAVERQGGTIKVTSDPGQGTSFQMVLPLTVSIARALLVSVDGEEYAMPLSSVVESQRLEQGDGHQVNHAGVFRWRGEVTSMLDLGHSLDTAEGIREEGYILVLEVGGKRRGVLVDQILGIQEVVVKGLDPILGKPSGIAATTVRGDGHPLLILDPRSLIEIDPFVKASA